MRCTLGLKDISTDCGYKPLKGVKHRVLMIRYEDVDRVRSVVGYGTATVDLYLKGGKSGSMLELQEYYKINGVMRYNSREYAQEITIRLGDTHNTNECIQAVSALSNGTWVMVVETINGTFEVLGFGAGLILTSATRDYNTNGVSVTLGTTSGLTERQMVLVWASEGIDETQKRNRFDSGLSERKRKIFDFSFDNTFE